jgi:hypothetical protein
MKYLSVFSQKMRQRWWLRHLVFIGAAVATALLVGYHYGGYDQSFYLPFLKSWADPKLFPGDAFIALKESQPSFFWFFFIPFYQHGVLEETVFVVYLFSVYLTFWGIWELSLVLFNNSLAGLVSMVMFIFPHSGFVGFPIIEPGLCNRTFVLPFLLFAFTLYLRNKPKWAFALLGVMFNLHLLTVNFALGMLLWDNLRRVRQLGWRSLAGNLGIFLVTALPVLYLKIQSGAGLDLSIRPEWLEILSRGMLSHIYYLLGTSPFLILCTLNGLSSIALFIVTRKSFQSVEHDRSLVNFMWAAGLVIALQTASALLLPLTFIQQLQLLRIGVFICIFALLSVCNFMVKTWETQAAKYKENTVLAINFIVVTFPIFTWLTWGVHKLLEKYSRRWIVTLTVTAILFIVTVNLMFVYQFWSPGIFIHPKTDTWLQVEQWAQKNTAKDAVFITPPEKFGINEPEWRVEAERSKVVGLADLAEIALVPNYLPEWQTRFNKVAPGAIAQFNGNFFVNQEITRRAYNQLSSDDLIQVACQYHAAYLVVETTQTRNFPVLYSNSGYTIYDLQQSKNCPR